MTLITFVCLVKSFESYIEFQDTTPELKIKDYRNSHQIDRCVDGLKMSIFSSS